MVSLLPIISWSDPDFVKITLVQPRLKWGWTRAPRPRCGSLGLPQCRPHPLLLQDYLLSSPRGWGVGTGGGGVPGAACQGSELSGRVALSCGCWPSQQAHREKAFSQHHERWRAPWGHPQALMTSCWPCEEEVGLPGSPVVKTALPLQRMQVLSPGT